MPEPTPLERVRDHLRLYDHPLLTFSARETNRVIEVLIDLKEYLRGRADPENPAAAIHSYVFSLHPRDVDHAQFEWHLQRQLYDALHDYFIEMFTRSPQDRRRN